MEQAIRKVERANTEALREYTPRLYPGRIVLFRAARLAAQHHGDPCLGWEGVAAGGIEVREIPGERPTIMEEPSARLLADRLREDLEAARAIGHATRT